MYIVLVEEQRKCRLCIYRKSIIWPMRVSDTALAKSELSKRLPTRKSWMLARRNNCAYRGKKSSGQQLESRAW